MAAFNAESVPLYKSDPVPSPDPTRPAVLESASVPVETDKRQDPRRSGRAGAGILQEMLSPEAGEKVSDS